MSNDRVRQIAADSLASGDALGWFEEVYRAADGDPAAIPWADLAVKPPLAQWLETAALPEGEALVVGCGLGDDAAALAARGMKVTAFDIAPTAIAWCRRRFADLPIDWRTEDLFRLPADLWRRFALVIESNTLQALPLELRSEAIAAVASTVAPDGRLWVICRGREASDPLEGPPWPLTREELAEFSAQGLRELRLEDFVDGDDPPVRRFRAEYVRAQ